MELNIAPCTNMIIYADEMGLGKTVEVISLVLLNPKPMEESKENQSDVDDEESIYEDDDDNSPQSGSNFNSGEDDNIDESSSESWHPPQKRKRTFGVNNIRESSRTYSKLVNSKHDSQAPVHPKFKGKRNTSPCTFVTIGCPTNDSDEKSSVVNDSGDDSVENEIIPSSSSSTSSHKQIKRQATEAVDVKADLPKKILKTSVRTTTFSRCKAVYEAELLNYSEVHNVSRVKFNGTFFETKIARISRFECICGGSSGNDKNEVI